MADFDMAETNYEDFYLSNFFGKKKVNAAVEVEIINASSHIEVNDKACESALNEQDDEISVNENLNQNIVHKIEYNAVLPTVKTDVIRHKNLACDRCEPQTLQIAIAGLQKNKQIKKALKDAETKQSCDKCASSKNKPKRSKKRRFAIVLLVIVFAFTACFLLADVLSSGYFIDSVVTKIFGGNVVTNYYAVEIATFSDVDSARITSEEIRASGGSGYVVNDELYRVIAEVYASEKDAESISTNLNLAGYVTNIYVFKIEEINYQLFPTSVRNVTKKVLGYQGIMYKSLFETAVSLEKQEIDYTSAREDIGMLKSQINNMLIDYESSVNDKIDNKYVQKVRMQISSMIGALDNLTLEGTKNDRLLSDIRYINTMILNTHRAMINSLQTAS